MGFWEKTASWAGVFFGWSWSAVRESFTLDGRSLALFRISLAVLILVDLATRLPDLHIFYTDAGVLPIASLPTDGRLSIHLWHGSAWFQGGLFLLAAGFALALLVGFQTQVATVASWFLLLSLHARNPLIQNGGDGLFRLLLFWGMFLPLGRRWSLDQALRREWPANRICSLATVALVLQVCAMYWFSVAFKTDAAWHDGTAIYYALHLDSLVTPLGRSLLNYPRLLSWLTFSTYWLEIIGPALLFVPFWRGTLRTVAVVALGAFHLIGLGLSMELILFPYVCAAAWLAFLPGGFWDRLARARLTVALACRALKLTYRVEQSGLRRWYTSPPAVTTPLMNGLAACFLIYVILWNVRSLSATKLGFILPPQMNRLGNALGLSQKWNMFAPKPTPNDGWYVVQARLNDGSELNLLNQGVPTDWEDDPLTCYAPIQWGKPELVSATFKSHRWRKYLAALCMKDFARYRAPYDEYLKRTWSQHYQAQPPLRHIDVYWVVEKTLLDNQVAPPQRYLMFSSAG